MRRRTAALVVSVVALGLAFAAPWSATAEQETCDNRRILVLTGNRNVASYDPGENGCRAGLNQNTRRILPGADSAMIRVQNTTPKAYPVVANVTTDNKTVDVDMIPDNEDPAKAGRFESPYVPIGSTSKLLVKVTFSNGAVRETTYTR